MDLKSLIHYIPDFPRIIFRDITLILRDPAGMRYIMIIVKNDAAGINADYIIEWSRGASLLAHLGFWGRVRFIPVRKPGKLPSLVHSVGMNWVRHRSAGGTSRCLATRKSGCSIDDLIATGGTAAATAKLVQQIGCELLGFGFIIELQDLQGRKHLQMLIVTLVEY